MKQTITDKKPEMGIIYPVDYNIDIDKSSNIIQLPVFAETVHCAVSKSESELKKLFFNIGNCSPEKIFIFGPLHKGSPFLEGPESGKFHIFSSTNCSIDCNFVENLVFKDDEVVSEEYCKSILIPFCDAYFPNIAIDVFLCPVNCGKNTTDTLKLFLEKLISEYKNAIFLFSNNKETNCCISWIKALNKAGYKLINF